MMNTYGHSGMSRWLFNGCINLRGVFLVKDDNDRYVLQGEKCARTVTDFFGYFVLDLMPWRKSNLKTLQTAHVRNCGY